MSSKPSPVPEAQATPPGHAAQQRRARTGEAERGLWQRTTYRRALLEALALFALWRLLELVPLTFWPGTLFPLILLGLLVLRFSPPVWATMRVIATRRERLSRRFLTLSLWLAAACTVADVVVALFLGDPAQPFGGPSFGPDILRFNAKAHHLSVAGFIGAEILTFGFLAIAYTIAVICTRLAQGGFLRFTMPSGNGRVTL